MREADSRFANRCQADLEAVSNTSVQQDDARRSFRRGSSIGAARLERLVPVPRLSGHQVGGCLTSYSRPRGEGHARIGPPYL